MFTKRMLSTSALVLGLATATVVAQGPRGGEGRSMGRVASELNLTDSQKQTAQTIFQEAAAASRATLDSLRTARESMEAAIKANKGDNELQSNAMEEGRLMGDLALVRARAAAKFYAMLTAEQKLKADKLPMGMLGFGGPGGERGRGRGPQQD